MRKGGSARACRACVGGCHAWCKQGLVASLFVPNFEVCLVHCSCGCRSSPGSGSTVSVCVCVFVAVAVRS